MAAPPSKRLISLDDIPNAPPWLEKLVSPLNAFIKATAGALDSGITFLQQFAGEVKTVAITPPDDWQSLTLLNGTTVWAASTDGPPKARKMNGMVDCQGLLKLNSTGGSSNLAQFPASLAPAYNVADIPMSANFNWASGNLTASTRTLAVQAGGALTAGTHIGIHGLRFRAADPSPDRWANPIDVKLGTPSKPFPGRPGQVLVLACRQTNAPTAPAVVTGVDWSAQVLDKRTPAVRLHRVWGLVPGVAYSLTLLVTPE
jgi:hypothetical protein